MNMSILLKRKEYDMKKLWCFWMILVSGVPMGYALAEGQADEVLFKNFIQEAELNTDFRRVVHTGKFGQVVFMNIKPGEDIGFEAHAGDQINIFVAGKALATVDAKKYDVHAYDLLFIPAGSRHNIANTGVGDLQLINIYTPPIHPVGEVFKTKAEAVEAEAREAVK